MLYIFNSLKELNFGKLMELYSEGNRENALDRYPEEERNVGILKAEQDFYQYLKEIFFPTKGAFYAVWEDHGRYISALRLEPYRGGLLLEALETHPDHRRKGYARRLILAVLEQLEKTEISVVYAHIHKQNTASLGTHLSCGFERISDRAVYIDGSVNRVCCTMQYRF